ncbi:MAG: endo-1,4-beta-xylanase [Bacteroidota bacterium]|nr:endo-1,4-beta-xylanase [Bacteroidota bacterium]
MKLLKSVSLFVIASLLLGSCKSNSEKNEETASVETSSLASEKGLKDYYADYFPIGVAVSPRSLEGESAEFIRAEFNSLTAENVMKMGVIHPEMDRFNWGPADAIANFAKENNLKLRGHNLVWHQQAGPWIFTTEDGKTVGKEELYQRMKAHIDSVVGRYKGTIYAWDVVNEAISDKPDEFLRKSEWLDIAGEEFIMKAFEYAHEADPDAKLYYNDYNAIIPEKRDRIYKLLKMLIDNDVPIDGVGIQGHWSIFSPTETELREAMDLYASLGLDIQITELDVSLYQWEKERRELRQGESDEFTPELEARQKEKYDMFFRVFRDYKDQLTGVTFWNVSDRYSWLDHYPVEGRKNYPLLFDEDYKRKSAYDGVAHFEDTNETEKQ